MKSPFFSIICPDYDGVISPNRRYAALTSVLRQSFPDWEMIVVHDGPRQNSTTTEFSDPRIKWIETAKRHDDWGHTLRDIGLQTAIGDYIVHFNSDNELYTHCLAILHAYSRHKPTALRLSRKNNAERLLINPNVLIFGIRLMGCSNPSQRIEILRRAGTEYKNKLILPGWPPRPKNIDAMQLVAKKTIWDDVGGWFDKSRDSDGVIYEQICQKFGYLVIPEILGEHW